MVKGVSRRVIVVHSPDPRFFEQAVFFLREDALHREGVTDEQVLTEARRVAAGYLHRAKPEQSRRSRLPSGVKWCAAGVALASLIWSIVCFL